MGMPRIIHCSDLILRINQSQEISNVTEWLYESTEFRPIKADTCEIRDELDNQQKILVIVMIWTFLVFLSIFYCYFCEQKLFPTQMLFSTGLVSSRTGGVRMETVTNQKDCRSRSSEPRTVGLSSRLNIKVSSPSQAI